MPARARVVHTKQQVHAGDSFRTIIHGEKHMLEARAREDVGKAVCRLSVSGSSACMPAACAHVSAALIVLPECRPSPRAFAHEEGLRLQCNTWHRV